jgi:hypothetical protein
LFADLACDCWNATVATTPVGVSRQALADMQSIGVVGLERGRLHAAAISGHHSFAGDSVIIELKSDHQSFAISDYGPAALDFAIRLQSASAAPLRIVDEGYTFDLLLEDYSRVDDLMTAIAAASA